MGVSKATPPPPSKTPHPLLSRRWDPFSTGLQPGLPPAEPLRPFPGRRSSTSGGNKSPKSPGTSYPHAASRPGSLVDRARRASPQAWMSASRYVDEFRTSAEYSLPCYLVPITTNLRSVHNKTFVFNNRPLKPPNPPESSSTFRINRPCRTPLPQRRNTKASGRGGLF